ncbi:MULTISPECIES: hypothetical protein [Sphingobium]|jgi:hypothetical protein|uniref:hypothetical protein n=1 Tax=Sphingobium TaxID=165695 RepID=UPI001592F730|nr:MULTISPECIES: hypothetical protein [Sphingobium]|tara:strand:+ start:367 stop:606 length:240 start_codon:yes stop_codon:yes gene_type:complete
MIATRRRFHDREGGINGMFVNIKKLSNILCRIFQQSADICCLFSRVYGYDWAGEVWYNKPRLRDFWFWESNFTWSSWWP